MCSSLRASLYSNIFSHAAESVPVLQRSVCNRTPSIRQALNEDSIAVMSTHADCRMYESKYPDVDDVVMVQVKSIAEMGAYVSLLEYNGIEGMILLSELSRRRIRSITKLIKVQLCVPILGSAAQLDKQIYSHQHSPL